MTLYLVHKLLMVAPAWIGPILVALTGGGEAAEHGAEGGHGEEGDHSGPPHLPNLVGLVLGHDSWAYENVNLVFSWATMVFMVISAVIVYNRRSMLPGKGQNFVEILVEGMYNFLSSILGKKEARTYTPFLGTLFFYILLNNFWGIIPGGHSPSTAFNVTFTLAFAVFCYVQYIGMRRLGIKGYLHHMAGSPRGAIMWFLSPIFLVLHIIGELVKPVSLSLRLYGNITGEDILVAAFVGLGIMALSFVGSPIGLPLDLPFIFLGILLSTIQALVFTLLSSIYILMMLPHEEHH
jgi:F-type H+-transporting ATPase subunit a